MTVVYFYSGPNDELTYIATELVAFSVAIDMIICFNISKILFILKSCYEHN